MKKLVVVFLALVLLAPTAAEARKVRSKESWRKYTGAARDYWLYVPPGKAPPRGRPLVVYLHGCAQNDDEQAALAFGTRWNELMAVSAVVAVPVIVLFVLLQRYIVAGLTEGATKG